MFLPYPADRRIERLIRCIGGLALFGAGINMFLASDLGLAPWDVFHQGLSKHTGIPVGFVIEIIGALIVVAWIPLKQRIGVGTILNTIEIGLVVAIIGDSLPTSDRLAIRAAYVAAGLLSIAVGSGLYIGAGLGPGPRDGVMLGMAARGISVRAARTAIEITVLTCGVLLGGRVGVGTAAFTFGIGPLVQLLLPRLMVTSPTVLAASRLSSGSDRA